MSANGYIMIDCTGVNLLAGENQTIAGIFDKATEAYESGKPIIAINLQYGEGVPMTPVSMMAIFEGGKYCFSASILQVWVDDEDGVEVVNLAPPANQAKRTTKSTKTEE